MSNFEVIDSVETDSKNTIAFLDESDEKKIVLLGTSVIDEIKKYVDKYNPKLHILTPCYGSLCQVTYVYSLMETTELCRNLGIELKVDFCRNDSLVTRARNNLIAKAMSDKSMTHVIFIDSDITWSPIDILKLMISDKSLVGGVYPLKKYNWDKLLPSDTNFIDTVVSKKNNSHLKELITDLDTIQHNLVKYNVNYLGNVLNIEKNLAKVRHIATGFMMIQRDTLEKMFTHYSSTKYTDDVGYLIGMENDNAYALFDCGVEDGHYLSEDWLFCDRWNKMGGDIHVDISINLTHTGVEDFKGSFISSLI